ncbi:CBS domain-containing protein [Marinobacter halotolerans]|uniref:hypothetical protein n=1 Tax=Marinobacter halotolerans TaxID=1569211 RepID=UPI001244A8AE|nr:hypothetical protein [Marinobacter halotolerans]
MSNPSRVLVPKSPGDVFRLTACPEEESLTGDDPATQLLKDFTSHNPINIRSAMAFKEMKAKLCNSGATFAMVVNRSDEVVGLLTLKDLLGSLPLSLANQRGGSISDITAKDVMRPIWSLPAVRYGQLQELKVDQLAEIFNELHTDYLLVMEADLGEAGSGEKSVRGLLSADDLNDQAGIRVDQRPRPESFSDIVHAVRGKSY